MSMGKRLCKDCERKKAEEEASRLMDSWMCFFYDDVWCSHSKIPKSLRVGSVCQSCKYFVDFMAEMDAEDEVLMDEIDDIRRNPEKYGYGGVP
jgi:hypothetical protein